MGLVVGLGLVGGGMVVCHREGGLRCPRHLHESKTEIDLSPCRGRWIGIGKGIEKWIEKREGKRKREGGKAESSTHTSSSVVVYWRATCCALI